jgi:hypothetical protein
MITTENLGKIENIETSIAEKIEQEKAELKEICDDFAQQVAKILEKPSVPSERAQQALNITEALAGVRRKVAALSNYGGAGALAAVEATHGVSEAHRKFVLAIADGWHTTG